MRSLCPLANLYPFYDEENRISNFAHFRNKKKIHRKRFQFLIIFATLPFFHQSRALAQRERSLSLSLSLYSYSLSLLRFFSELGRSIKRFPVPLKTAEEARISKKKKKKKTWIGFYRIDFYLFRTHRRERNELK